VDDIRLSAQELRSFRELEKVMRHQNRILFRTTRAKSRTSPRRRPRGTGRCVTALTSLAARLMARSLDTPTVRRSTRLAFGLVWTLTTLLVALRRPAGQTAL
jgi:hypothetical protein